LPRPRLSTAPAVFFNQNVNENENQKACSSPLPPLVHELLLCTLPRPRLSTAPAVFFNQNVNENENQKAHPSPLPPLVPGFQPAPCPVLAYN